MSCPRRENRTTLETKRRKAKITRKTRSLLSLRGGAGDAILVCIGVVRD